MALSFYRGKLGGGGWIADIIWSPDGLTGIIRTDVYVPWIWEPSHGASGLWRPLVTATSMPEADVLLAGDNSARGWGCYAIDVARSNSNIIYMVSPSLTGFDSTVYKSTNRGTTFTATGLTPMEMSVQSTYRFYGKKMMIHPTDPDIVIVTNNLGEAYRTANGGTSWTQIAGLPVGDDPVVQWDLSDGTICYLGWRTGDHRLYRSTDSGVTFSQMAGGPDNLRRITSGTNGKIYMTSTLTGQNVWRLVGTTFTNLSPNFGDGFHSVAVSPVDPDRVTIIYVAGNLNTSLDGGDTFGGMYANAPLRESSDDIQWLEWTAENYMSTGDIAYDPLIEDKLWFAEGIGVWYTTPPLNNAQPTWTSMTRGQEELIVNDMRWPPGERPYLVTQDRGIFRLDDFGVYPSTHGPGRTTSLQHCYGMDYASSDPNYLAVTNIGGPSHFYTADGGDTYTAFSPQPTGTGGNFAVLTPLNMVFCPANNGFPQYTTDGGATWTLCTFPGDVPTSGVSGFSYSIGLNLKYMAADRVDSVYYAYNYLTGDMYKSSDGGANFTKTADAVGIIGNIGNSQAIVTVPGHAGHVFFTSGSVYNDAPLRRSKNADDASATWGDVAGTQASWAVATCAPAPGQSYPAVLLAGKCNGDTLPGIYLSIDDCATWVLQTRAPANEMDIIRCMAGNPDIYGQFIFGGAAGYFYTSAGTRGPRFGLQF